jgi:hypothetical protein
VDTVAASVHAKVTDNAANMALGLRDLRGGYCVTHTEQIAVLVGNQGRALCYCLVDVFAAPSKHVA